jgi:hypothetical protein
MNDLEQCYEVLEIASDASIEDIKQAYKDLAQFWHPDRYAYNPRLQQKAEAKFKDINMAYYMLMEHFEQKASGTDDSSDESFQSETQTQSSSNSEDGSPVEKFVKALFKLTLLEQSQLEKSVKNFSDVGTWKLERSTAVGLVGGTTGAIGGPIGVIAIPFELALCERQATTGAFGIGHLLGCKVDYDLDREIVLAIWAGEGSLEKYVPEGKVGIKINDKAVGASATKSLMGIVLTTSLVKGSSKLLGKLSAKLGAKAVAKMGAKMGAKASTSWIPIVGGIVSGGVNVWLVQGLLDAAEQYYSAQKMDQAVYLVLNDSEVASAI